MIKINFIQNEVDILTCIYENPFEIYELSGKGTKTTRLYVFVECALCLQSLFQQNKTNVLFREIARLIARNSYSFYKLSIRSNVMLLLSPPCYV